MPAVAAHYQLGRLVLAKLPEQVQSKIKKHQAMFDIGTQGPDLFFYYRPIMQNNIGPQGHAMHTRSGYDAMADLLKIKAQWSDAFTSYMLGFVCHYVLDATCHPYINRWTNTAQTHQSLESEFERLIVTRYQMSEKRKRCLPIRKINAKEIVRLYPTFSKGIVKESLIWIHVVNGLFGSPSFVKWAEKYFVQEGVFSTLCMPDSVEKESKAYGIMEYYEKALQKSVDIIQLILDTQSTQKQLHKAMQTNFEGVIV